MKYQTALTLLAFLAAGGCSGTPATGPMSQTGNPSANAVVGQSNDNDEQNSPRSGALHVTKECSQYTRLAGGFCTLTSSNLKQIPAGTKVIYLSASGATVLDTDVILEPPGPGNNRAFGHVVLNLVTRQGVVTLSGGTGKFQWISARADISHLGGKNWAWEGAYSFGK